MNMIIGIVICVAFVILGVVSIVSGVSGCIYDGAIGVLGIVFGALLVILMGVCIIGVVEINTERTEKIIGRGVITASDNIDYTDGGGVSSDKVIFYFLMENGDKIIVDKTEWESDKTEFTYKKGDVENVKE